MRLVVQDYPHLPILINYLPILINYLLLQNNYISAVICHDLINGAP